MIFCLPLLLADGRFTSLDKITVKQLEKFIPFMVSCSVGREKPPGSVEPLWWPSDLPFAIPLKKPHNVRHKWLALLKSLVCRCYTYHGCEFMLRFCTDLTNTPNSVLTYVDTWNDTVSVYSKKTGKLVVTFRTENMTYDKPQEKTEESNKSNGVSNEVLRDNTHFLDIYVCEMCDFTFPNLESAQEHEEICKFGMVHPAETEVQQFESQQETFLKGLGLKNSAQPITENKKTSRNVTWKLAGVSFARSCAIPVSSPLGLALYRKMRPSSVSSEVHLCKVERHCGDNADLSQRTRDARHTDGIWPTTWKRNKTSMHTWAHSYKFPRKHLRSRPPVPDTGLKPESLKLLRFCKPFSVVLHKLQHEEIKLWSNRTVNIGLELHVGTSSENISDDCVKTVEEEPLLKHYLTALNSHICSGNLFAYDAVTKELICQSNCQESNLLSEQAHNIVCINRTYSCEAEQSEKLSVLDSPASCVPVTEFSEISDSLAQVSSSPTEGTEYRSSRPSLPQSIAAFLETDDDVRLNTSGFSMSEDIEHHLTQFETSSLYIPAAYSLHLYPVSLHSEGNFPAVTAIQAACGYPKSQLISHLVPKHFTSPALTEIDQQSKLGFECVTPHTKNHQCSFPLTVSDISLYSPQLYSEILNPPLLHETTPIIYSGLTQKSCVERKSTSCDYSEIISDECDSFPKNSSARSNSDAFSVNTVYNHSEEQKTVGEQDQEDELLPPSDSVKETISGPNILPVSQIAEKLDVYQNVEQSPSLGDVHFTQRSLRSVSLNCEHETPNCNSRGITPSSLCAGSGFKSEEISCNKSSFSSLCEPELVYGSVTFANTSQTRSDFLIHGNNMYRNCTETSESKCAQRLLFKSPPSEKSKCAKGGVVNPLKTFVKNFPKKHTNRSVKTSRNSEILSREVQKLMKDECVNIRDKQFFKILNCDCKVLRKREIRRRCTNRVSKVKNDFVKPCRTKSFKAYKYVSTCKLSKGVNDSFCLNVVDSVEEVNSKEHVEVPLTSELRCVNYPNKSKGRTQQLFSENSTSINVNHKIQNSLSMHYELQSVKRNSVELKLESSDSVQGTCIRHCGQLESFHQYSVTSVIDERRRNPKCSQNCSNESVIVKPHEKPVTFSSFVNNVENNSANLSNLKADVSETSRLEKEHSYSSRKMKLRSQSLSSETVVIEKTHRVTHKTVRGDHKTFTSGEKHRFQKNKIIKHLSGQINLRRQFTDMYHVMLEGSSGSQPSENEECCGYVQFCSSSRLRIFKKRQLLGKHTNKTVSKELQRLLQDECKELVNLGLERTNMPIKESSRSSSVEISKLSQLREVEEDHREWFNNKDVMCVINFPYEFSQTNS